MRRPNPWIAVPVVVAAITGAVVGFQITRVSCAPGACLPLAVTVAVLSAAAAFFGVATVMVLAIRSIAEWRQQQERGGPPPPDRDPGPPTC